MSSTNESDDCELKYYPFESLVETSFWHTLSENKLNIYKLSDTEIPLQAFYRNDNSIGLPPIVSIEYESFMIRESWDDANKFPVNGTLLIANTIEEFKSIDKTELSKRVGNEIWSAINSPEAEHNLPSFLSRFILLAYADLKKYHFYYWFCFPSLCYPLKPLKCSELRFLKDILPENSIKNLIKCHQELSLLDRSFFITFISSPNEISLYPLSEFQNLKDRSGQIYVSFADPSTDEKHPGWPLRNLIAYVLIRWKVKILNVLCYRKRGSDAGNSLTFQLETSSEKEEISECPGCVGWSKNEKQKLLPRVVDLSSSLDPKALASNSVDLNLKLMRWRLVPDLNLEKISSTKCLLLGAGTLGCNVARCLMAWGVRHITFVDSGKVSYSNPVRQSLFVFEDCLDSGKPKAEAAAQNLKKIFPHVISEGYSFMIPMPGHVSFATAIEETKRDVNLLESLIDQHDCIFLLMDSRESRWLPTVIGQVKRKLVINAALGFDTYLVQRHGIPSIHYSSETTSSESDSHQKLGCYFCNDVVAPGDSSRNRTLDQQCTVTRPGVSMIAASLAVELMISVLQHPMGVDTPAKPSPSGNEESLPESILGIIPHQIRGFLSQFGQFMPTSFAFNLCTACSPIILKRYEQEGFDFLLEVFKDGILLEQITGLKKLLEDTSTDDVWALSDDESS
ncbi:autophagy-related 7 isoform X2 [Brevipalpus obovatus]|uniref:autophagy-related 7 isoform X2 n=1 Tax=Brevipalpus obovatus TaxID=246614 RepID=UPI003D9F7655